MTRRKPVVGLVVLAGFLMVAAGQGRAGLAVDLAAIGELPPMARQALANRKALRQTIDTLWPAKAVDSKLIRRGNTLRLATDPEAFVGAPATMGVLVAIAIPAFINYIRKSKQAEGYALVEQLAVAEEHHKLEHGKYLACPAHPPRLAGGESQPWGKNACFEKLGFAPESTYFSIQVDVLPDGRFEIRARADLDDDGQPCILTRRSDRVEVVRSPPDGW